MIKMEMIGNIGQNAKQQEINGRYVTNFSVAHNQKTKDAEGNEVERTVWVSCSVFRDKSTDLYKYLTKGTKVFISGVPNVRTYSDSNGQIQAGINLLVKQLEFVGCGKSGDNEASADSQEQKQPSATESKTDSNDLPF